MNPAARHARTAGLLLATVWACRVPLEATNSTPSQSDASSAVGDAAVATFDASVATFDAAVATQDAAVATLDAAVQMPDAAVAIPDAAVITPDAAVDPHTCPAASAPDCSPGSGTGNADQCFDGPSCYVTRVQAAVNSTVNNHPEWFDTNNPQGCPNILNVDAFLDNVVGILAAQNLCAIRDPNAPGEEVTVKHDNAFTENFDIVASTGCARSGAAIYTGWCAPAWW